MGAPEPRTVESFEPLEIALEQIVRVLLTQPEPDPHSPVTVRTLAGLCDRGATSISLLAEVEGITQPAMSQLVSRLEAESLVERVSDPADARRVMVRVTARGKRAVQVRRDRSSAMLHRLAGSLDESTVTALLSCAGPLAELAAVPERERVGAARLRAA